MFATHRTQFDDIMDLVNDASTDCNNLKEKEFTACVEGKLFEEVNRLTNTTQEMRHFRDIMAPRIQNYVCADNKANLSEPLRTIKYEDRKVPYSLEMMVEVDRAKVWVVRNAISPEECSHITRNSVALAATTPTLVSSAMTAEVASTSVDGSSVVLGGASLSESSESAGQQLGYELPVELPERDRLW